MSKVWSSFFILLGVALVVLALWYLSYLAVRWDTRRRGARPIAQKAWVAVTIALPLFGFALYLFTRILQQYLSPRESPDAGKDAGANAPISAAPSASSSTDVYARAFDPRKNGKDDPAGKGQRQAPDYAASQVPMPEPAWGKTNPAGSNGKAHAFQTPETIRAPYQPLRLRYMLLAIQGPLAGQEFPIKLLPVLIGRGSEAAIALDADLNVSRKHAEIYEWNGMLRIRDLGSMHGTQINGVMINDQALTSGDRITLGGTVLILRDLP